MKISTLLVFPITAVFTAAAVAADPAASAASAGASTAAVLTMSDYLLASAIAAAGNAVHFVKKNVTGETNKEMMAYLKDHSLLMLFGVFVAIVLAIIQAKTIFSSGEGQLLTAFLTGFTADSILGKYTPKESITKEKPAGP